MPPLDLLLTGCRLVGREGLTDLGLAEGRIVAVGGLAECPASRTL